MLSKSQVLQLTTAFITAFYHNDYIYNKATLKKKLKFFKYNFALLMERAAYMPNVLTRDHLRSPMFDNLLCHVELNLSYNSISNHVIIELPLIAQRVLLYVVVLQFVVLSGGVL